MCRKPTSGRISSACSPLFWNGFGCRPFPAATITVLYKQNIHLKYRKKSSVSIWDLCSVVITVFLEVNAVDAFYIVAAKGRNTNTLTAVSHKRLKFDFTSIHSPALVALQTWTPLPVTQFVKCSSHPVGRISFLSTSHCSLRTVQRLWSCFLLFKHLPSVRALCCVRLPYCLQISWKDPNQTLETAHKGIFLFIN